MPKVLIVEDEQKLASLISDYLRQAEFDTTIINNGNEAEPWLEENQVDIILLDLMLPGKDGMQICKDIREHSSTPIIMITAKVEEVDRLLGLELGADDYICKPFSPKEVVARVKAVLRRTSAEDSAESKGLSLDIDTYKAKIHGEDLGLTAVEFQLLKVLSDHPGRIFSRSVLVDQIYSDGRVVSDRTIDSHIKKLRKKIATVLPDIEIIHSLYAVGYKFEWQ